MYPELRLALWCWSIGLACIMSACHSASPGTELSSETHFLMRCGSTCPNGLSCICGVCSASCESEQSCRNLSPDATCRAVVDSADGTECSPTQGGKLCDLTCKTDVDCAGLSSAHLCEHGVCRRNMPPAKNAGGSALDSSTAQLDAAPSEAGRVDAGSCTCTGPRPLSANVLCSDGSIGGPVCESDNSGKCSWQIRSCPTDAGPNACQPSECTDNAQCGNGSNCIDIGGGGGCVSKRCCPALACNPMCSNGVLKDTKGCETCECAPTASASCKIDADCPALGLCVPCNSGSSDPCATQKCSDGSCQWQCSVSCGPTICAAGEACCDHCNGRCVPANSGQLCPDDNNPSRTCPDAGSGNDAGPTACAKVREAGAIPSSAFCRPERLSARRAVGLKPSNGWRGFSVSASLANACVAASTSKISFCAPASPSSFHCSAK